MENKEEIIEQNTTASVPAPKKKKGMAGKIVALAIGCTIFGAALGAGGVIAFNALRGPGRMSIEEFKRDGFPGGQSDRQRPEFPGRDKDSSDSSDQQNDQQNNGQQSDDKQGNFAPGGQGPQGQQPPQGMPNQPGQQGQQGNVNGRQNNSGDTV